MYERELKIQEMMAEGVPRETICKVIGKTYNISPRSVETQYYHIVNAMEHLATEGRAELRANLMARNDSLFKKAVADEKYKTALDINVVQAKLGGLFTEKEAQAKQPEVIEIGERDFSVVPDVAENE